MKLMYQNYRLVAKMKLLVAINAIPQPKLLSLKIRIFQSPLAHHL